MAKPQKRQVRKRILRPLEEGAIPTEGLKSKTFMDLERVAGTPMELTIGGQPYIFSRQTLADHAEVRTRIRANAMMALDEYAAMSGMPETKHLARQQAIFTMVVDEQMIEDFYSTLEGIQFMFWQSLKKRQPHMTLQDVEDLMFDPARMKELVNKVVSIFTGVTEADVEAQKKSDPQA